MATADELLETFDVERQAAYFKRFLEALPYQLSGQDTNRMTILYFCVSALDLLGALDGGQVDTAPIIEWIYAQQILPDPEDPERYWQHCGFRGGSFMGNHFDPTGSTYRPTEHDWGHLAMTYTALQTLQLLGDDLSRVNKDAIIRALRAQRLESGNFSAVGFGAECDMRFMYTACAISFLLQDWSAIDKDKLLQFVIDCTCHDGGIGLMPTQEAHGGSTYCAVAALALADKLDDLPGKDELIQWCVERQCAAEGGFQGRSNKDPDTCYGFWVGAALTLLGHNDLVDRENAYKFQFQCQTRYGGFSKTPGMPPDPLHAYYSLAFLSITGAPQLKRYDCALSRSLSEGLIRRSSWRLF